MKTPEQKLAVMHAIWLCAYGPDREGDERITKRAADLLRVPEADLFKGMDADWMDRCWCSRPPDWKPADSLAGARVQVDSQADPLVASLLELSQWARAHLGPKDGAHEILVRAATRLKARGIDPDADVTLFDQDQHNMAPLPEAPAPEGKLRITESTLRKTESSLKETLAMIPTLSNGGERAKLEAHAERLRLLIASAEVVPEVTSSEAVGMADAVYRFMHPAMADAERGLKNKQRDQAPLPEAPGARRGGRS
jgi:hypothetical protein